MVVDQNPAASRFLPPYGDQLRCTIHRDSMLQCKFSRCVVMRVTDVHGTLMQMVRGAFNLNSDNQNLWALGEEVVRRRPKVDSEAEP